MSSERSGIGKWLRAAIEKRGLTFSDMDGRWAVEVFPADTEVVNVANMRHLWILPKAPAFAWRKGDL